MELLKIENLTMKFEGLCALDNVDFDVRQGEIYAVIGPNGAGKSTVFNCINKFYKPTEGHIYFKGQEITELKSHNISGLGIARTFQNLEIFPAMTAMENILTGAHQTIQAGVLKSLFFGRRGAEEKEAKQKALDMLEFLGISSAEEKLAVGLPYGFRKLLEIARALLSKPALLLMDEPAAGMNDREKTEIAEIIKDIREDMGITVLLVEHEMNLVMGIADRITVLDSGMVITTGTPEHVRNHPKVIEAYLGTEEE